MADKLQKQRFEYKYHVNEYTALAIRDFVSSYLDLDEYGATRPDLSYPVHSLYLDSPGYKTYMDTINGERNRYKLRIRYYETGVDGPVFFEMKRRINQIIAKKRAKVYRSAAESILNGHFAVEEDLVDPNPDSLDAIISISEKINHISARPAVHVSYMREAWMADGNNKIRVTMDRNVQSEPVDGLVFKNEMIDPISVFGNTVILELKFTDRFPDWFKTLVQIFGLRQGSAAKYVDGLQYLGRQHRVPIRF
ncbi:MAG: polyphosphate polymerase domain-containing protein [Balneolia bacterium]|nr:polyphosphate polymerase domain-containing protein [Balneolia bacterium]